MRVITVKQTVRIAGILIGFLGLVAVLYSAVGKRWQLAPLTFRMGYGLIGLYFLYVGYLSCRRFSPSALRHVCGIAAYLLLGSIYPMNLLSELPALLGFMALYVWWLSVFCLYRWLSTYLLKLLFGSVSVQAR